MQVMHLLSQCLVLRAEMQIEQDGIVYTAMSPHPAFPRFYPGDVLLNVHLRKVFHQFPRRPDHVLRGPATVLVRLEFSERDEIAFEQEQEPQ